MKILAQFPLKILIPILFFITALFTSYLMYIFNIDKELNELKERELESLSKNMMQYQGRINFTLNTDENIKREISYIFSEEYISGVFLTDDNLNIKLAHNSSIINDDLKNHIEKDIIEDIVNIQKYNIGKSFIKNDTLYGIYPIIVGKRNNTIKRDIIGLLIIKKELTPLIEKTKKLESQNIILPISIYFIIISMFVGMLYYHFVTRIDIILDCVHKFSNGIYQKSIVYGNDEISILSKKLDNMMLTINEQQSNLTNSINLLNQYKNVVDLSSIVSKTDTKGKITYVNDKFCETVGYKRDELIGKSHTIIRHPSTPLHLIKSIWDTLAEKKIWIGIIKDKRKDGSSFVSKMTIIPIIVNDKIDEYIALRDDVTELIKNKEKLKKIFNTDSLTSLSNRFEMINDIQKSYSPFLVLFNIDSFKMLNDYFGCQFGDLILIEFSKYLDSKFSTIGSKCYRFHADEFAVLKSVHKKFFDEYLGEIQKFIDDLDRDGLIINGKKQDLMIRAGVSFNSKELLIEADIALKSAKIQKKKLVVYNSSLKKDSNYANTINWSKKIKKAIESDKIVPFFQPIYDNKAGEIKKYESLVRLIDEDDKIISPFFFLDISKKVRLYNKIMEIMVVKTFEVFQNNLFEFSINLTVEDILNPDFIEFIFFNAKKYNVSNRLIFELVESEGIENFEEVNRFILKAKDMGCKIAIDDFGTGYSNFEYLIKIDSDYIKIDGSMIKNIDKDENSKDVVKTIVDFAKKKNLKTIAEFVSSQDIFEHVKSIGIDYSQGYFIAEPKEKI